MEEGPREQYSALGDHNPAGGEVLFSGVEFTLPMSYSTSCGPRKLSNF